MNGMPISCGRREFLRLGLGAVGAGAFAGCFSCDGRLGAVSRFRGIQLGAITYSFRSMPGRETDALAMVGSCRESGVGSVELMGRTVESFLRAPTARGDDPEGVKRVTAWRERFDDWGRVRELRDRFADAGIGIHIVKFGEAGQAVTSDAENDYFCRVAREMGARIVTRELPKPALWETEGRRLAKIADRNDVRIAFHNHGQLTRDTYEGVLLGYSQNLGINFDIGHYVSANDDDPLAFVRRFHDRIASVHLKDRTTKAHGQKNLPWGEGETPLGPLFALMLKEGYGFHADVELEYRIPSGSDAVREVARCIRHAQGLIG